MNSLEKGTEAIEALSITAIRFKTKPATCKAHNSSTAEMRLSTGRIGIPGIDDVPAWTTNDVTSTTADLQAIDSHELKLKHWPDLVNEAAQSKSKRLDLIFFFFGIKMKGVKRL